jgi:hypothetical protein
VSYFSPSPTSALKALGYQLLLNDHWAGIVTNALAVLITSASGPIFELLVRPLSWLWRKLSSRWNKGEQDQFEESRSFGDSMGYVLQNLRHVGGGYVNIPIYSPAAPNGTRAREALGAGVMLLILVGPPLLLLVASIVSARLSTDSTGLSSSDKCGRYFYEPDSAECSVKFLAFERRAEVEAAIYAMNCYGSSSNGDHCTKFYNQSISYPVGSRVSCPFVGNVCLNGKKPAYQLSTGLVSGSVLGINAMNPFLFSRTMTCSPIVNNENYVNISRSSQGFDQWAYWYGQSLSNYTWANPVQESLWEIKGYSARSVLSLSCNWLLRISKLTWYSIHCSEPNSPNGAFTPLPEFTAGPYPVTLMFISSHSILYPHFRLDPVFPAQSRAKFPLGYEGSPKYFHNSTRATVLGCVDQYRICKDTSGPCWTNENITSIPQAPKNRPSTAEENVVKLLLMALDFSSACGSTQFRGAEALDAQSKISHMQSQDLASEQWQVEVEKIFQTSLARIQLNAYDIVRGTAAAFDGYHDTLPAGYRGICSLVAIQTAGWQNLNVIGLVGTIFGVALLWIISRKVETQNRVNTLIIVLLWRNYLRKIRIFTGRK